jgi:hypothetical protein
MKTIYATTPTEAPHTSVESRAVDHRKGIDGMSPETEAMPLFRTKISTKPEHVSEEKIAHCLQSIMTESPTAKDSPIKSRCVAKGPGKTNGRNALLARWHVEMTKPLAQWETATVAWLVGGSNLEASNRSTKPGHHHDLRTITARGFLSPPHSYPPTS